MQVNGGHHYSLCVKEDGVLQRKSFFSPRKTRDAMFFFSQKLVFRATPSECAMKKPSAEAFSHEKGVVAN